MEKTLIDINHYSNYNQYLKSLKLNDNIDAESPNSDDPDNALKEKIKINSIEILINILTVVPNILKSYIIGKNQKNKEHPLLAELCNILIHQENFGVKYEIGELIKSLLDNEVSEKKNEFYDLFFSKCLKKLIEFVLIPIKHEYKYEMISSKQIIIEILCHCLRLSEIHGESKHINLCQRMRYWAIHNDLITKILTLLDGITKVLQLHVVKFMKSVVMNNDENLNKLIISNDSFEPIIKLYNENSNKTNLITSAILDLFDYIKKMNCKKLISYLVI